MVFIATRQFYPCQGCPHQGCPHQRCPRQGCPHQGCPRQGDSVAPTSRVAPSDCPPELGLAAYSGIVHLYASSSLSMMPKFSITPKRLSPCIWCFLYIPRVAHPQRGGSLQSPCISCFCRGTRPRTTAHCMPRNENKFPTQTPFSQWHTLADHTPPKAKKSSQ